MIAGLAIAALVSSTTIPPLSAADLVDRSDVVARVVVNAHHSEWVGRKILTFYDVTLVDIWHASSSSAAPAESQHVVVAFPGGVVGDIGQRVAGTPELVDGASYVLCMSRAVGPQGARAPIGLWQGVWRVDEAGALHGFTEAGMLERPDERATSLRSIAVARGAR